MLDTHTNRSNYSEHFQKLLDMKNKFNLEKVNDNDVLSIDSQAIKVCEFREALTKVVGSAELAELIQNELNSKGMNIYITQSQKDNVWQNKLKEGINGEILRFGSYGWEKGQVKISLSLEFCPNDSEVEETPISNEPEIDLPDSPLDDTAIDDIRILLNEDGSLKLSRKIYD